MLLGAAVAVAGAVSASALSFSAVSPVSLSAHPIHCPIHPVVRPITPSDYAAAARAVQAQIPRVYRHLTSQGDPAWPHAEMTALVNTSGTPVSPEGWPPPLRGIARYRSTATRTCGHAVASASLVAFLYFPGCQLPCASDFAYVTLTHRGWRLWISHRV
jgi:hypothetical protein